MATRITGTHVYTWMKCPTAVGLDLHGDRAQRRPLEDWEEFVRKRGRDFEEDFVATLDVVEPEYERGEFAAGAERTLELMREGHEWIFQGVLRWVDPGDGVERLGLPDLMRRVEGESELGGHHYEVVDVKTSGRPRGDQVLQVVFYSRLLAAIQGREATEGGLILKDGREQRFALAAYRAALAEVERGIVRAFEGREAVAPMHGPECSSCHWSSLCGPELEDGDDLSLVQGMTRGLRTTLQRGGFSRAADLLVPAATIAKRARIEGALARRLHKAAVARSEGRCLAEGSQAGGARGAILHVLSDPFADRLLWVGASFPAAEGGAVFDRCPDPSLGEMGEWQAFAEVLAQLPDDVRLFHYGAALPRWYEARACRREAGLGAERRFVDLARQLRGAAIYPGPVFGLAEHVRLGLGRDPHRAGNARGAALWATEPDGGERALRAKGASDLADLGALRERFLLAAPAEAARADAHGDPTWT